MQKLRWLAILMGVTILGITGFQGYWLNDNYEREKQNLEIKTNSLFHQTILRLQSSKLNLNKLVLQFDSVADPAGANVLVRPRTSSKMKDSLRPVRKDPPITMINLLQEKIRTSGGDTGKTRAYIISGKNGPIQKIGTDSLPGIHHGNFNSKIESIDITSDSFFHQEVDREMKRSKSKFANMPEGVVIENHGQPMMDGEEIFTRRMPSEMRQNKAVFRFLSNVDSISVKDSVTVREVALAYNDKLKAEKIKGLAFAVSRLDSSFANSPSPNEVTIGFAQPLVYHLSLENKVSYILKKLSLPILFSILLVGITVISFVLLYRNLVKQKRLSELKNEFISNITHELKTPIATVGVAIEALKNFNAIQDPQRTKEYLDISQNELQRLSLLVDKVLKLSMFENGIEERAV